MKRNTASDLAFTAMGAALIAVCSWISVPAFLPSLVPFTLQTFAVCLVTAVLGLRLGVGSVGIYLLLGAIGAPVFAGFKGGFAALLGTTGGYLVGFLFAYCSRRWRRACWPAMPLARHGSCLCIRGRAARSAEARRLPGACCRI